MRQASITLLLLLILAVACGAIAASASETPRRLVVEGTIYDDTTGEVIPLVTVQVAGMNLSTPANNDGRYRLLLAPGEYELNISHVGYYSQTVAITVSPESLVYDIRLKPSAVFLGAQKVFTRAYDAAQQIIAEAIARKKDILSQINDYSFDAYNKVVIRNANKPDSESIWVIAESQSTSYWEQPDKYKEIISARRQTANVPAESVLLAVGELLNFNLDRVTLAGVDIVSPTARDAMDHYNYYLLDTLYIDNRPVFVLEVEPKDVYKPLFIGEIQIADSTFDVVNVDVGFTKGVKFTFEGQARYYQRMAHIQGKYWMPTQIGLTADINLRFPGLPSKIRMEFVASIYSYRIDVGHRDGTFDEYEFEVAEEADDADSAAWFARQTIPLTELELHGYRRLDSLSNAPKPFHKQLLRGALAAVFLVTVGNYDLFHFNRVEGPYLGAGLNANRWLPNTRLRLKTGYAFEDESWQYELGLSYRLSERRKLWVGASIKDEVTRCPTVLTKKSYNPTMDALLWKVNPLDFYREKGFKASLSIKPINYTRLKVAYHDFDQSSKSKQTDYSFFRPDAEVRENPPIDEGHLRSVSAVLEYDSRKLIKDKGRDLIGYAPQYVRAEAGVEYASPDLADTDFDFRRYYLSVGILTRLTGLGTTSLSGFAGGSDGILPRQKFFVADYAEPYMSCPRGFNTFEENNFGGNRMAAVYVDQDLGPYMFRSTGIGLLEKIPFGLCLQGGALWCEFRNQEVDLGRALLMTAPKAYTEVGFGITNLTPFIKPLNFALHFTWQLSDYDTAGFTWLFSFRL